MSEKHTPGPWAAWNIQSAGWQVGTQKQFDRRSKGDAVGYGNIAGLAFYQCRPGHNGGPFYSKEQEEAEEADACLIAAAPDMLEALEELVDLMEAVRSGEYLPDSFTTQPARAALAKVNGTPAPIEASQAGGQLPDVVQVPREVYDVVLKRLDYTAKYICQHGDTHDAIVREHERLKMCAATQEK